jgi:hypothetical protein
MASQIVPVRILADTTAGLPQEFLRAHPIEVVPQVILFGEESLLEEVEISYPEFVRRLRAASELPKTAAPPPGEYIKSDGREVGRARTLLTESMLASDPLFLPALIDLFATRNLVTVCIGVDEGQSAKNTDINFSLSSRADYRIVLSHYPDVHGLAEYIVKAFLPEQEGEKKSNRYPKEQLVSLVVDNVTGKHYGRELRWLYATTTNKGKTLHCDTTPKIEFGTMNRKI